MKKILSILILSLVIFVIPAVAREGHPSPQVQVEDEQIYYNINLSKYQQKYTYELCKKYDLSYELVLAVMYVESKFDSNAKSNSSQGVMQINKNTAPEIAKQLGVKEYSMFNFGHCTAFGCYRLNYLRNYWYEQGYSDEDTFSLMLISYHKGISGCKKYVAKNGLQSGYVDEVFAYKTFLEMSK